MHSDTMYQRKRNQKSLTFPYAIRSFIGYLEGTAKSSHTIKNYRFDLVTFQQFLEKKLASTPVHLSKINREDLERYHEFLKAQGLKTNTRRRKLLTVRRLLRFLKQRNKLAVDVARKLPTPYKIERIPLTLSSQELLGKIQGLPHNSVLETRNRTLLWTLAETGCLVSEIARLRFDQWERQSGKPVLVIQGKAPRALFVSEELFEAVQTLKEKADEKSSWIFLGFNKFGPMGSAITPRGIELLVKSFAIRFNFPQLTPRIFRHSAVLRWFEEGKTREQIQKLLGLKTPYAFRVYEPLFKSSLKTTSNSEKIQTEF